jgi:hypothetical protein
MSLTSRLSASTTLAVGFASSVLTGLTEQHPDIYTNNEQTDQRNVVISLVTGASRFGFTATTTTTTHHARQFEVFSLLQGICDRVYVVKVGPPHISLLPLHSPSTMSPSLATYWQTPKQCCLLNIFSHFSASSLSFGELGNSFTHRATTDSSFMKGCVTLLMRMICQARVTYVTITYHGHA